MWNFLCEPKKYSCQKCPWEDSTCRKAFVCDWCGGPANLFYPSPDPFTPEVLDKIVGDVNNVEPLPYGQTVGYNKGLLAMMRAVGARPTGEIQISDRSRDLIATCLETEIRGYGLSAISTRPPIWGF